MDWIHARPGDAVRIQGGATGVLQALPDRRGRVAVGVGNHRVLVAVEKVGAAAPADPSTPARSTPPAHQFPDATSGEGSDAKPCDLRGLRVSEALDRLDEALDRASLAGRHQLSVIHGVGSGALRRAVREHLAHSEYVDRLEEPDPGGAGDGISIAQLHE